MVSEFFFFDIVVTIVEQLISNLALRQLLTWIPNVIWYFPVICENY